jgi:predicted nucleic acid-binding Zn finger protein
MSLLSSKRDGACCSCPLFLSFRLFGFGECKLLFALDVTWHWYDSQVNRGIDGYQNII